MDSHFHSMGGRHYTFERPGSDIKKTGYLRKLKTMKKRFFVLRSTSSSGPARLEYYDSEKKFHSGTLPKRSILLHTCFNINKKSDSRHGKVGIVLYTIQDSFTILTESEEDQATWLSIMLEYQNEYIPEGDQRKEHYEHVWQVTMQPHGLGQGKGVKGQYRLCLNSKTVCLYKVNSSQPQFTIQLVTIRAVAHNENSFWMTVGNYAATGAGEFKFLVEDTDVAKNIHTTVLCFMNSMKDYFQKDNQFVSRRDAHSNHHDDFGGPHQLHSDFRKSFPTMSGYPDGTSQDFMIDYPGSRPDSVKDLSPALCSSDLDGEKNSYFGMAVPECPSMMPHYGLQSSHSSSIHTHNFSELLHLTHLPTVKEGGSGEGYLLSDLPNSCTSSSDFPRPEPATCLLLDDHEDLPPRTYSLGSRPTKKLQSYQETGSRKGLLNEISRATSAPHILKGRRDREHRTDSPSPAVSPLSMSLKSDDSESFMEHFPMRPRTASDSFNYRPRTSSFGKMQQTCRPRSSSYGQGKRPVINIHKLNLEKAMMSKDKTSWESSLQSSFESLHVSSESLRKTSQELRQPVRSNTGDLKELRNTPSPKMKSMKSEPVDFVDVQGRIEKRKSSPHCTRTDSSGSGRTLGFKTSSLDQQQYQPCSQQTDERSKKVLPNAGGGSSGAGSYANVDYNTQHSMTNDTKSLPPSSQIQPSRQENPRCVRTDGDSRYQKSGGARSLSVENVDTYFISDFTLNACKPRTGSVGSKDKKIVRPGAARKPASICIPSSTGVVYQQSRPSVSSYQQQLHPSVSSSAVTHQQPPRPSVSSSSTVHQKQPHPLVSSSGVSHQQQPHPSVLSSGVIHQQPPHPLVVFSTRNFGSSDSIRKPSRQSSTEKYVLGKDFRKKSGSTGSRPASAKTAVGMALRKEQHVSGAGILPVRKLSSANFFEDDPALEYVEFSPSATSRSTNSHYSQGQSSSTHSELSHHSTCCQLSHHSACCQCSGRRRSFTCSEGVSSVQNNPVCASAEDERYTVFKPPASSTAPSVHAQHQHVNSHLLEYSSSCSPISAQIEQVSAKEGPDVACGLGMIACSASSHSSTNKKVSEAKGERVGFKHGLVSSSAQAILPSSVQEPANDLQEYIEYDRGIISSHTCEVSAPSSAVSYIQNFENSRVVGQTQKHKSLNTATSVNKPGSDKCLPTSNNPSSHSESSTAQSRLPPIPPLPSTASIPQHFQASSKQVVQEENKNLNSCPDASTVRSTQQDDTFPAQAEGGCNVQNISSLTHLSLVSGEETNSPSAAQYKYTGTESNLQQPLRQHAHKQQQSQNFQRQLSVPAYHSIPTNSPAHVPCELQQPQTQSQRIELSNSTSSVGCKHLGGLSVLNSPTSAVVPAPAHSLDEKSKDQLSSGDKPPPDIAERHPLSPSRSVDELTYSQTTPFIVKPFESKLIPAKARTRHSLGDIMSVVSVENRRSYCVKSAGDASRSGGPVYAAGSQDRHSISDLASCEQMISSELTSHDTSSSKVSGEGISSTGK